MKIKKVFFVSLLVINSLCSYPDKVENAINAFDTQPLLWYCQPAVKIDAADKERYLKLSQEKIEQAEMELRPRFSRSDKARIALGGVAATLTSVALGGTALLCYWLNYYDDYDEDDKAVCLICGIPSVLSLPLLAYVAGSELSKGFTKYDRTQKLNKAHAVQALVKHMNSIKLK